MRRFILFLLLICLESKTVEDTRIAHYESEISSNPENAQIHFAFGEYLVSLDDQRYYQKAYDHLRTATNLCSSNFNWQFALGSFCCRIGRLKESLEAYQAILKQNPRLLSVLYNSGYTFKTAGNIPMAITIYRALVAKNPEYEPARLGLSFALINNGDFQTGCQEHIWNLKKQNKYPPELCTFLKEGNVSGKTILLVPEGGLGDSIQFVRYAQRLKGLGAQITLAVQKPLIPLLSRCSFIDTLVPMNTAVPPYDAKCTLMTLSFIFGDSESQIPQNIPYIFPDPERINYWKKEFRTNNSFKVGICWQPDVHNDVSRLPIARRGIPLSQFYEIGALSGVTLYSLQQKEGLDQLEQVPPNVKLHVFDSTFDTTHGSFMDTAAVIHALDLVISTDTATAHLAGAMGKRVWLLLPYATDWRWLSGRTDSPWYPTMRIFKQPHPFDWNSVMKEVQQALEEELSHM